MILYKQDSIHADNIGLELDPPDVRQDMEKTRRALDVAYSGFNNATDFDLIDSYIFEIKALQQRYDHLATLAGKEDTMNSQPLCKHSAVRSWVAHILH